MIKTAGWFWKREDTFWGKGGNAGRLLGVSSKNRTSEYVDFAEQIGIYILYSDFEPVYAGQAGSKRDKLINRLRTHRRDELAPRWNRYSWFGLRGVNKTNTLSVPTKAFHPSRNQVLNHLEGILIHSFGPHLNKQGGRFGADFTQYLQVRDPRLEPTSRELLKNQEEMLRKQDLMIKKLLKHNGC